MPLFARDVIEIDKFPEVIQGLLRTEALAEGAPIQRRMDIGCAQSSAPAMRFADFSPGASVELCQFHPHQPTWRWTLPLDRPRVAYRLPKQSPVELRAKIRSLIIRPDKDLVSVVWVGEETLQAPIAPEQLRRAEYGIEVDDRPLSPKLSKSSNGPRSSDPTQRSTIGTPWHRTRTTHGRSH